MAYCGFVVTIDKLEKHGNADRLMLAELRGCQVIVGLDTQIGDRGVMFPAEGQLDEDFARKNGLLREKDEFGNPIGNGYLDPIKRNIQTLRLRGERSEGIFVSLKALKDYCDVDSLKDGDEITTLGGVEICKKYVPMRKNTVNGANGNSANTTKKKKNIYFPEHIDTKQIKFCWSDFKIGDLVSFSEKLEGTSGRSLIAKVPKPRRWYHRLFNIEPGYSLEDCLGSRRVQLKTEVPQEGQGFYGDNSFRVAIHNRIKQFLKPNMEVFYEIVGYLPNKTPIMGNISTKPLKDKNFTKKYGDNLVFHYGCEEGTYDFYIYRIVELDGDDIKQEWSTYQIRDWCAKCGFKTVPLLGWYYITSQEELDALPALVEQYADGESTLAPHWREGVVVRRENVADKYAVYKHKNFTYRLLKGMYVSEMEVAEGMTEDILEEL